MRSILLLLIALMTAGLLASLLAVPGGAEQTGISLAVSLGYGGVIRPGQWMPVTVEATNRGTDFVGVLEVEQQFTPASSSPSPQPTVASQLPLTVAAGATRRLGVYVLMEYAGPRVVIARAVRDGRTAASRTATAVSGANTLVGVLSDEPAALDDLGAIRIHPGLPSPQVVHLGQDDLPDSAILLRAFDILAIDNFATDSLTGAQRTALGDYVAAGGNLLIGTGPTWSKTLPGIPARLLPALLDGTVILSATGLSGVSGLEVANVTEVRGRSWMQAGQRPLLLEKSVGGGLVTLATFDWTREPIVSWSGTRELLRQVAVRSLMRPRTGIAPGISTGASGVVPAVGRMMPGFGPSGSGGSVGERSPTVFNGVQTLPALQLPSLWLTGLLVLLYIVLVAPANYLLVRRIGRPELAWITLPLIAILFAAGAYGLGIRTRGSSVQINQVSVVHLIGDWGAAYRETYTGVFTAARGDYSVVIDDRSLITPIPTGAGYGPQMGGIRMHPDRGSVDLLGVTAFIPRTFATENMIPAPAVTATLRMTDGKLAARIENRSSLRLTDAVVVAGDAFQPVGDIAPGSGLDVSLEPTASISLGEEAMIQSNRQPAQASAGSREMKLRAQILQLVLGPVRGAIVSPTLIAWTADQLEGITVEGHRPPTHAQSAVVVPLVVDGKVSGPIRSELFTARLVDASGEVDFLGGTSLREGPGATATLEFYAPVAPGQRMVGAGIAVRNLKFEGPRPFPFESLVWDWPRRAWVPIALTDGNTAAVPAGGVSGDGTVRLRVRKLGGLTLRLGTLSLVGEIR